MEYGKLAADQEPDAEPIDGVPIQIDNLMADMHSNASQQVR